MEPHQLSEPYAESETSFYSGDQDATVILADLRPDKKTTRPNTPNGEIKTEQSTPQNGNGWRGAARSPDSESTNEGSFHSPLSPVEVPTEVLEGCDGLDDVSSFILSPEDLPPPHQGSRGRGRGRGRGQVARRVQRHRGLNRGGRKPESSDSSSSSESTSSSSFDSSSPSTYSESENSPCSCSGTCSHSSSEWSSCSCGYCCSTCSSLSSSSPEESSTSYESLDDLTAVPRAKRGGARLGPKGVRKVANQCQQS